MLQSLGLSGTHSDEMGLPVAPKTYCYGSPHSEILINSFVKLGFWAASSGTRACYNTGSDRCNGGILEIKRNGDNNNTLQEEQLQ